ncbi:MAG: beta-lactamase domain protein [Chitinophagaceae bacterium]|nr:beta-lactamase domain protein [Chitinophagaceae bacterium]
MSLFISSLNSGSNGNCYYVGNETEAILVDAGISCSEIENRMKRLGLSMQNVKAVFVSHEHTDHISGLQVLAKKYKLPVYITNATHRYSRLKLEKNLISSFTAHEPIIIGNLSITAFPKFHDAADPYSFIVNCNHIKVGVFTDIGTPCENLVHHFKQCHAAFLEANYDDTMLDQGRYPHFLKNRIRGDKGHLSNKQALELFTMHKPSFMTHLLLSHLSKNNNCPKLVQELFNENANGVKMIVASRNEETAVYHIHNSNSDVPVCHQLSSPQLAFAFA